MCIKDICVHISDWYGISIRVYSTEHMPMPYKNKTGTRNSSEWKERGKKEKRV